MEVLVAGALSALLFVALLDVSWRIPAMSAQAQSDFEDVSSTRSALLTLSKDLRGASRVLEVSDTLLRLDAGGEEVSWSFSGGSLRRSFGAAVKTWPFSGVRFSRDGQLVRVELEGPAGPMRAAVLVYGGD